MSPPTIANGKVYLASFGADNIGTGQFCVYGLLPDGAPPARPVSVSAAKQSSGVALSWDAATAGSIGHVTYRVSKAEDTGGFRDIALGLTTPAFFDNAISTGHSYRYVVTAQDANGASPLSDGATITIPKQREAASHVAH